ncbi:MAG: RHS repeat-associated core domain-containing protein [Patescibacteria group bacterium]
MKRLFTKSGVKRLFPLFILALLLGIIAMPGRAFLAHITEQPPIKLANRWIDLTNGFYQGNFTYAYPLDLPEGMGGLAPSLALCYNSELAEERFLAVGWELAGLDSITRDTTLSVPSYDDLRDTYLLTLDGRSHRIRNETGRPYFENAAMSVDYDKSADKWTVAEPDGVIREFVKGVSFPAGTFNWVLSSVTDPNGNRIAYDYDRSLAASEGVVYPSAITYLDAGQGRVTVEFVWESAGDQRYESYWSCYRQVYTKRLAAIKIAVLPGIDGAEPQGVTSYTLTYRRSRSTANNLLAGIAPDIGSPVAFTYESDGMLGVESWQQTEDWALPEEIDTNQGASLRRIEYDFLFRDLNQDGYPDLLLQEVRNGRSEALSFREELLPRIYLNNKMGGWIPAETFSSAVGVHLGPEYCNPPNFAWVEFDQQARPVFSDLNGDGYLDITFHLIYQASWYFDYPTPGQPAPLSGCYYHQELLSFQNDGQGRFTFLRKSRARMNSTLNESLQPVPLADLDGDGQADLDPFVREGVGQLLDANGDDLTDLYFEGIRVNQGGGTFLGGLGRYAPVAAFFKRLRSQPDLNNDGRTEQCTMTRSGADTYQLAVACNARFDKEFTDPRIKYCRAYFTSGTLAGSRDIFADLDNDGDRDLFMPGGACLNLTKPDLLSVIEDEGDGARTTIRYQRQMVTARYGDDDGIHLPQVGRWAVASVQSDEGLTTFTYSGGLLDAEARCFRGYASITVAADGEETTYTYATDDPRLIGMCTKITGPEETVTNEYTVSGTDKCWSITKTKTVSTSETDGTQTVENAFDQFGNLTRQDKSFTPPDMTFTHATSTTYEYAQGGFVHAFPSRVLVRDAQGKLMQETAYLYDDLAAGNVAKGNLTRINTRVLPPDDPDGSGQGVEAEESDDLVTSFKYDSFGRVSAVLDAQGHQTITEDRVTLDGRETIITNALSHVTRQVYDPVTGLLRWSVDANGRKTSYEYYPDRRLKKVTRPDGGYSEYLYSKKNGAEITITLTKVNADTDPATSRLLYHEEQTGKRWRKTIDQEVLEYRKTADDKYVKDYIHWTTVSRTVMSEQYTDAEGRVTSASLPYLKGETPRYIIYTYEPAGKKRLLKVENPDGTYLAYTYDDAARRVTVTDQTGRSTVTTETFAQAQIEGLGTIPCRIVTVTSPGGAVTRSYYNLESDLLQVKDALGRNKITKYDNLHRVVYTKDPFKGEVRYYYNAAGQLKRTVDNKGVAIDYIYDALGRLEAKRFPSGREITYMYDLTEADDPIHTNCLGRLSAYRDGSGLTRLGYDTTGKLLAVQRNGFAPVRYTYDFNGQVTSLTYPDNYVVNYQYELGSLARVADAAKTLATYSNFNAYGLHRKAVYGNNTVTDYTFNPHSGRLEDIRINQGQLLALHYTYDPAGNIAGITDNTPLGPSHPRPLTETYAYDPDNRLVSATGPYGAKTYSYDALGNFLVKEGVLYHYTDLDCPYAVTEGSDGFRASYDANGNMIARTDAFGDSFAYTYDEENQLIKAVKNGSYTESFTYDANGMRVRRSAAGQITDYFFDGVNLLFEKTGDTSTNYVWANGTLLCTVKNGDYTYYHTDHLGTSKLQTDDLGAVKSIDITKPYGPVARAGVLQDTFANTSQIDLKKSKFVHDAANGAILPPNNAKETPKVVGNNQAVQVLGINYETVKTVKVNLAATDKDRKFEVRLSYKGKARLTVADEAGNVQLTKEYSSPSEVTLTESVKFKKKLGSTVTVTLELAALNASTPASNSTFEITWGSVLEAYGVVYGLPQALAGTVYSIRLNYTGAGVVFYVSTNDPEKWQELEPGEETVLEDPGTSVTIKALLKIEAGTVLHDYRLELNPYHDMSFTGKFFEPEIGLVYFGGRWYEPGIGRWMMVDPAEDGGNWYGFCNSNPIEWIDTNGYWGANVHGQLSRDTAKAMKLSFWTSQRLEYLKRGAISIDDWYNCAIWPWSAHMHFGVRPEPTDYLLGVPIGFIGGFTLGMFVGGPFTPLFAAAMVPKLIAKGDKPTRLEFAKAQMASAVIALQENDIQKAIYLVGQGLHALQDIGAHGNVRPFEHQTKYRHCDNRLINQYGWDDSNRRTKAYLDCFIFMMQHLPRNVKSFEHKYNKFTDVFVSLDDERWRKQFI